MERITLFLVVLAALIAWANSSRPANSRPRNEFQEVFKWNELDYEFPSEAARTEAIESREFIPGNSVPMGIEVWRDKLFISVPRLAEGVPSSLNYVKLDGTNKSPRLIPYPNWEVQSLRREGGDLKIISPFRMNVDKCNRLWMVDLGINDIKTRFQKLFQPRILVFNLETDELVLVREIEPALLPCRTWIANIIVEVDETDCSNAFAYIPDLWGKVLIVFRLRDNVAYQVNHQYFNSDPLAGNYNIGGFNFRWDDGIFGVALSPPDPVTRGRTLFFHSLSAYTEFSVATNTLQSEETAKDFYAYKYLGHRGPLSQAGAQSMDDNGVLFYVLPHKNAVGCWNSRTFPDNYSPRTSVPIYSNNITLLYPSDLKVDKSNRVWVISNKLPVFNHDALTSTDVNFRILRASVTEVVKNTPCDARFDRSRVSASDNSYDPEDALYFPQRREFKG